jgi:hypothetical protein
MIKSKKMRVKSGIAPMKEMRDECRIMVGQPEGRRLWWVDNTEVAILRSG